MNYFKRLMWDLIRTVPLLFVGFVFIFYSNDFAIAVNEPAFSPWGLHLGGLLLAVAMSHLLRRLLFPKLDLQVLATSDNPIARAIVVLAMCVVLAAFVLLTGTALRV